MLLRSPKKFLRPSLPANPPSRRQKRVCRTFASRQNIERGAIDYLTGTLAHLTKGEATDLDQRHRNFSILESARHGGASLMLGGARFVNHCCRGALEQDTYCYPNLRRWRYFLG
jgi:hypothetical protein